MKKFKCFVLVCSMICGSILGGWSSKPASVAYACSPVTESSYDISDTEAKDAELRAYFNSKSWYRGTVAPDSFDVSVFNQYEKANLELIVQYEKKMHYK